MNTEDPHHRRPHVARSADLRPRANIAAGFAEGQALALWPGVAHGTALDEFPALKKWAGDFRHLPGFIGMSGIFPVRPA